jgi:hypothetical protein
MSPDVGTVLDSNDRQEELIMVNFPGWVAGAAGTAAIVGSFYAGSSLAAQRSTPLYAAAAEAEAAAPLVPGDGSAVEVECEPGQRAVVRQATARSAGSVACMSSAAITTPGAAYAAIPGRAAPVSYVPSRGYASPAVINEPVEVYRPRATPVRYQTRDDARATRSVKKSVAIIASSTAVGATIGGLAKGKRGALIGGIVGGGAATVWDQVTRRRDNDRWAPPARCDGSSPSQRSLALRRQRAIAQP